MEKLAIIFILVSFFISGCIATRVAGGTIKTAGKVAYGTAKVTAKAGGKVGKAALNFAGKSLKTAVNMATGKEVINLTKKGNSLYVDALINRRLKTQLILDTGCSETQISSEIAQKLGININKGQNVLCTIADGRSIPGKLIYLRELRLGRARVTNVKAIVLDQGRLGNDEGLLGMSFLNNFIFKVDTEKDLLVLHRR